jgi:hypothetical protein
MGILGKLISVTLDVVEVPLAVVKDVATMGGALTDESKPYTAQKIDEIGDDYKMLKKQLRDDL